MRLRKGGGWSWVYRRGVHSHDTLCNHVCGQVGVRGNEVRVIIGHGEGIVAGRVEI